MCGVFGPAGIMKLSYISGLVAIITLALIGLIAVQYFWIHNSYDIKKEQFEQSVYASLNRVSEDISDYEVLVAMREEDMPFPFRGGTVRRTNKADLDTIINRSRDHASLLLSPSEKYDYWRNARRDMDRRRTPVPMFPDADRDSGFTQTFSFERQVDMSIEMNAQGVVRAQTRSVETQTAGESSLRQRVDRVMRRLERAESPIDERIDKESFEYILHGEMQKADIDIPFEYAVLDASKTPAYHSEGYDEQSGHQQYLGVLFPMDIATEPYVLTMYFPSQQSFIFQSIGVMASTSIVLVVAIMIVFVLVTMVIIRQKKLADLRTDFVNNVTHELKTPIATISLASQMLGDPGIPSELKNYDHLSSVISHETKRLSTHVEKVLQMAIFERGTVRLNLKQLELNPLAEKVADTVLLQVRNKGGRLTTHFDASPDLISADEIHFTNVLFNLCDNAVKYSTNGPPDITLRTYNRPQEVVMEVSDKGIGIAKSDQKRIFDQFYRVQMGNVHNVKGFGLGLTYVKKVVEAHHGHLEVESELGSGTTFRIRMPQSVGV